MVQLGRWSFNLLLLAFSMASAYADVTTQNALLSGNKKHKEVPDTSVGGAISPNLVCHKMLRHVFENATPRDEQQAGVFEEYKPPPDSVEPLEEEAYLWNCLQACCEKPRNATSACNVVLVFKGKCYHIRCQSNEACLPKLRVRMPNEKVQMVLVNPLGDATWPQLLKAEAAKQNAEILPYDEAALNFWKQPRRLGYLARNQVRYYQSSITKSLNAIRSFNNQKPFPLSGNPRL